VIKGELEAAAFGNQRVDNTGPLIRSCEHLIRDAHQLAT
jgi:hypothetical protein